MTFEMKQLAEIPGTLEILDMKFPENREFPGKLDLIGNELSSS